MNCDIDRVTTIGTAGGRGAHTHTAQSLVAISAQFFQALDEALCLLSELFHRESLLLLPLLQIMAQQAYPLSVIAELLLQLLSGSRFGLRGTSAVITINGETPGTYQHLTLKAERGEYLAVMPRAAFLSTTLHALHHLHNGYQAVVDGEVIHSIQTRRLTTTNRALDDQMVRMLVMPEKEDMFKARTTQSMAAMQNEGAFLGLFAFIFGGRR